MMRFASALRAVGLAAALFTSGHALAETVTTPSGFFENQGPANATGPGLGLDTWYATNVRAGGGAGITDAFARSGNGSIQFSGPTNAKADFEYYFSAGNRFLLSQLSGLSYEWYRSDASTAAAKYHPSLRLYVTDGSHTGYLVYEGIYNGLTTAVTNAWNAVTVVGTGADQKIWATGSLPDAFTNYNRTAADWAALLPNLTVLGLSTGIGSGWDGSFLGAVDNISYTTTAGVTRTFNFETTAVAVPEPASIALLGVGLLGLGLARRRKAA